MEKPTIINQQPNYLLLKALLFINGKPPERFPDIKGYDIIACTDGAFQYLEDKNFPIETIDFLSGDFDSIVGFNGNLQTINGCDNKIEIIETPDQNKTDFEKALEILIEKNAFEVDVLGGSSGEMDHFLGNLSVAFRFKDKLKLSFYDDYSTYFFIPKTFNLQNVKGNLISIYPFPTAEKITTKGLNWELNNENLEMHSRIGIRNFAKENSISINYKGGNLLLFIGKNEK